jgi:hypothetical protein
MENFSQLGGLLQSAAEANQQAQEDIDRIQNRKIQEEEAKQEADDAFAQAGELLGGGLMEKGAENLIKKGIKYGKGKLQKLGLDPEELDKMTEDYKSGGTSGLLSGIIKRKSIKTQAQLKDYLKKYEDKLNEGIDTTKPNISVDEFGLPVVKADLPPDVPIQKESLVQGRQDILDPEFSLSKYKVNVDPSTGTLQAFNRDTGKRMEEPDLKNEMNQLKKNIPEEFRFDAMGLNNDHEVPNNTPEVFEFKRPIQPRRAPPVNVENATTERIGDVENLPNEFKSNKYLEDFKNTRDYGKNISKAFMGERQDDIKLGQLKNRISDLKERKGNLDSDSFRNIYKESIKGQPRVSRNPNGEINADSLEKNVSFREGKMDAVEKLQGGLRGSETSQRLGIVKQQIPQEPAEPSFSDLFPEPPKAPASLPQEPKAPELPPKNTFESGSQEETTLTNVGSQNVSSLGSADAVNNIENSVRENIALPEINNEIPTGGLSSIGEDVGGLLSKAPALGDVLAGVGAATTLAGPGTLGQKAESLGEQAGTLLGQDVVSKGITAGTQKILGSSGDVAADVASGAEKAGEAGSSALSAAGETDLALGGPEDPVGDVVSAVVGLGVFLGSLFGDKPKPPPPPPKPPSVQATFQLGQDA